MELTRCIMPSSSSMVIHACRQFIECLVHMMTVVLVKCTETILNSTSGLGLARHILVHVAAVFLLQETWGVWDKHCSIIL